MVDSDISQPRLAVLIDADNAQAQLTDAMLTEVAKYGVASVKRIYGDWTTPNLGGWKKVLLEHSIQPVQQFRYTVGKNATDSAMIIDAMDLLYTKRFDGFCVVSSDSDFTRLASRIREEGLLVYGIGKQSTPKAFVSACDKFIYTEVLDTHAAPPSKKSTAAAALRNNKELLTLLRNAVDAASDEGGWANLGVVGSNIAKQRPEFDPRNYGFSKLGELVEATKVFDVDKQLREDGSLKTIYIRKTKGRRGK